MNVLELSFPKISIGLAASASKLALIAAVSIAAIGCGDNLDRERPPDPTVPRTVGDHVRVDDRFSQFEDALFDEELLETLDEAGPLTLFAPTNAAVDALTTALGIGELTDASELVDLLNHHVVDGAFDAEMLKRRTALAARSPSDIHVRFGTAGILLDDGVVVTSEAIVAENGILHVIDAVLDRPLVTTTTTYSSEPNIPLPEPSQENPFGVLVDRIDVADAGSLHDVSVTVDVGIDAVFDLRVFLVHETTGRFIRLVSRPRTALPNLSTTFADSASFDIINDAPQQGTEAFPEDAYRPDQALELIVGEPLNGGWLLNISNRLGGQNGVLRSWSMKATYSDASPTPAIAFPRRNPSVAFGSTFKESVSVEVARVNFAGSVSVSAKTSTIDAGPSLLATSTENVALLEVDLDGVPVGGEEMMLIAEADVGGQSISRIRFIDTIVREPDRNGLELLSHIPLYELDASGFRGNDVWGWTDTTTNREYALMGTSINTTFVDVTIPNAPVVLGHLPTRTDPSSWRDIKVFADHAFIVSEADGHGMQVFDLTLLRGLTAPQTFAATAVNSDFGQAHNIVIDEATGFAYVVGATDDEDGLFANLCSGGLMMFDLATPTTPTFAGCFGGGVPAGQNPGPAFPTDAYIHDAQCVVYNGPDTDYTGREICISSDGQVTNDNNYLAIADVTVKTAPVQISRATYDDVSGYAHQGWLTEDHRYFILNDEFDEFLFDSNTVSYVWDLQDLDAPVMFSTIINPRDSVGHNTYVVGDNVYQANYTSGLRVVDISDIANENFPEVAYFDTYPDDDDDDGRPVAAVSAAQAEEAEKLAMLKGALGARSSARCKRDFDDHSGGARLIGPVLPHHPDSEESSCGTASFQGAWSNYPFFASGTILISDIDRGLFIVAPE